MARAASAAHAKSDTVREAMLDHIDRALDHTHAASRLEAAALREATLDRHAILDPTKPTIRKPQPQRWHAVAEAYARAAEAAAAGDLVQAARRLETARDAHAKASEQAADQAKVPPFDPTHPWHTSVPRMRAQRVVVPPSIRRAVAAILDVDPERPDLHGRILKPRRPHATRDEDDDADDADADR